MNYTAVPESETAAFAATFQEPSICTDPRTLKCDDAHKKGLLSKKSLDFLRAGKFKHQKVEATIPFLK